jgi:hypothetical protein
MSREELIILEKDIKAELAELQAKRNLIIPDDTTTAATLYAELAFIKAAKRQQLAATGAESPGMKEIAELKPEISTLEAEVSRITSEMRTARRADGQHRHKLTRLERDKAAIKVKKRLLKLLKLVLSQRDVAKNPHPSPKDEDIWHRTEMMSLDTFLDHDRKSALEDPRQDSWLESACEDVVDSTTTDDSTDVLHTLAPLEEKIIRLRFGIGCEREHTPEEIGVECNLTRERIRQIEAKALRELRAPTRARRLRTFMADR